ncbi:hypothetical protein HG530_015592 [Fusarium avenaceum]|nr:hypothetical protein HG530_015592 [Fusarium avenaceum]
MGKFDNIGKPCTERSDIFAGNLQVSLQSVGCNLLADLERNFTRPLHTLEDAAVFETAKLGLLAPELSELGSVLLFLSCGTMLHLTRHLSKFKYDAKLNLARTRCWRRAQ